MFDIDKRGEATTLLRLRNDGEREGGLARRFRAEHFHHTPPRKSAHAQSAINQDIASGNYVDIDNGIIAESHDRTFAIIFRDLLNRQVEVFVASCNNFIFGGFFFGFRSHRRAPTYVCRECSPRRKAPTRCPKRTTGRQPRGFAACVPNQNDPLTLQRSCVA